MSTPSQDLITAFRNNRPYGVGEPPTEAQQKEIEEGFENHSRLIRESFISL